jgi:hypothetical protein
MGTVLYVSADTQAGQFSLNSDVRIRSGELYFFERNFYILQGFITFRENETKFDPLISARAEIRDRSETGPVTITLVVENQPLFSFAPFTSENDDYEFTRDRARFEATPSLTPLEIYSILGQNINTQENDPAAVQRFLIASTTDALAQIAASSDVVSQFVFLRQFERQSRNYLNLDMLSFRTRFLYNAIVTTGTATTGIDQTFPDERVTRVGNLFDNSTVFVGKYIGQNMFVQSTFTMRYDESSIVMGGLSIEPDIGIELQSPLFSIRWNFFPYHPENWWFSDHSITLNWSKSF